MTATLLSLPLPKARTSASHQDHQQWGHLQGSSRALAVAQASQQAQKPLVLVTADTPSALKLEKEIRYFLGNDASNTPVTLFPDWETLPYDTFSPHQDIISQRLETLFRLTQDPTGIFIVPVNTLMQRLAPVEYIGQHLLLLKKGQQLDRDTFRSIRLFDTDTQRSSDAVNEIRMLPAREFPTDKNALNLFRQQFLDRFEGSNNEGSIFGQITRGTMPSGVEYYLPLFFEKTATLFDYFHPDTQLVLHGDVNDASEFFWADVSERYEQYRYNKDRPLLPPDALFLPVNELFSGIKQWPRVSLSQEVLEDSAGKHNLHCEKLNDIALNPQKKQPAQALLAAIDDAKTRGAKVLFCAESQGRRENLLGVLRKYQIKPVEFSHFNDFLTSHESVGISIGMVEPGRRAVIYY